MASLLPHYLTEGALWVDLLPIPIIALLLAALVAVIMSFDDTSFSERFVSIAAFSLLGFVIGDLAGQSREPAVAATIGAILTLLGGTLVYMLGVRGAKQQKFASAGVCVLAVSLFFGTNWGSVLREKAEMYKHSAQYRIRLENEDAKLIYLRKRRDFPDPVRNKAPQTQNQPQ